MYGILEHETDSVDERLEKDNETVKSLTEEVDVD